MSTSDVLAIIGIVASLIGIPLSWFLARRGRQRPDLRSAIDFDVLIDSEDGILDRLNVEFDGTKMRSVSRSIVAIWNERGDTVRGSDILPTDRLRLRLAPGDVALHARIVSVSRTQIDARCVIEPSDTETVYITFDFLDAKDGFIVEVVHMVSEPAEVCGTVRGAVLPTKAEKVSLTRDSLEAVAERWLHRRIMKAPRRRIVGAIAISVVLILGSGMVVWQTISTVTSDRQLVSTNDFDMQTLDGQRAYASAVRDANNIERIGLPQVGATALIIVLGIVNLRFVYLSFSPRVPRTIVQEILD